MADYTCDICGEMFSSGDQYEQHRTASHPGSPRDASRPRPQGEAEGRGEIEVGDWMMGQNDVGRRDRRSETSAFRCSFCGEQFDDNEEFVEHMDSTHQRDELTA